MESSLVMSETCDQENLALALFDPPLRCKLSARHRGAHASEAPSGARVEWLEAPTSTPPRMP